jgi:hypothetical protein
VVVGPRRIHWETASWPDQAVSWSSYGVYSKDLGVWRAMGSKGGTSTVAAWGGSYERLPW